MRKNLFFGLLFLFTVAIGFAQNTTLKTPPSFQFKNKLIQKSQNHRVTLKEDVSLLRAQDMERIKDGHPLRVAIGIPVNLEFTGENVQWLSLPGGEKIWQQSISSEGAEGLILSFDKLYIPEGGELYIYTENREQVTLFTSETNPAGEEYASGILYQNEIVLEYVQPAGTVENAIVKISDVGYLYRERSAMADDMTCYINAGCEEGANWQMQKNAVVGMWMQFPDGWYVCTGSLINNVRQDGTPYILTANHCIDGIQGTAFSTMRFDFFKESTSTNCTDQADKSSLTKTLTGATLIADIPVAGGSDGTLLKLTSTIPSDWLVYYNGWDARGIVATSGVGIHHPDAMVKKISTFTKKLSSSGAGGINMDGDITAGNAHWVVNWAKTKNGQSVTYGGSSGSPLYNENGHVIGTLTGGSSFCDEPNEEDFYGKFSYHWDKHSNNTQWFKNFLDPDNTGVLVLDGYDPHAFSFGENTPTAKAATNITEDGFTANWDAMGSATKYYLDVYQIAGDLSLNYVDGYKQKNVGNVTSATVTGLNPSVRYCYVVRAGAGLASMSGASNEISLTTLDSTLDHYQPTATAATDVYKGSFQANWNALKDATSYSLNVYQKAGGDEGSETVDFTGSAVPSTWTSNVTSSSYYTSKDYIGKSAPSLKLDATGKYLESPKYAGNIKSIEFWYRGASASASSYLTISTFDGSAWNELKKIQPLVVNVGTTVNINESELPEECTAVKFVYTKNSGNLALDDIKITCGDAIVNYVSGYEALNVGNTRSYVVNGLEENTQYYYTVFASNDAYSSKISNEIGVKTNNEEPPSAIFENSNDSGIWVDNENLVIKSNSVDGVAIYNVAGQLVLSRTITQKEFLLPKSMFVSGMYFVKLGSETHKVLIK